MNETNTSSNFRLPAFIAMALTASTVGNSNVYDTKVPHPYYSAIIQSNVLKTNRNHTVSNVDASNGIHSIDVENYKLVRDLGERLVSRSKDIDSQIAKIVDDNFWDLI